MRVQPVLTAVLVTGDGVETMRTLAPPAGRGWEYLAGTVDEGAWAWADEPGAGPSLVTEKAQGAVGAGG
ncbi:hypothetical protein GCM10025868_02070 [Angustibacter aerolatus]|uniref:Uncharacterized protein n=1 Tax=Angustibacter aerolatus TaxID=1162965 RepID=A0ABQ6J9V2_9ACTN|nr:hypothetical protein [Angustibacter aerolatus]GMA84957.1 hypothetical protein GCM10025868_02070 [Angustibacter aerolatus]